MAVSLELDRKLKYVLAEATGVSQYRFANVPDSAPNYATALRDRRWHRGTFVVASRPLLLLRQLYTAASPGDQAGFLDAIERYLTPENARMTARIFVELRAVDTLFYWQRIDPTSQAFWQGVADTIGVEPWLLSDDDLDRVSGGVERVAHLAEDTNQKNPVDALARLREQIDPTSLHASVKAVRQIINRVRVDRIEESFSANMNPAIDFDRRQLLTRIEAMGFSGRLSAALQEVERRGSGAVTAFDFKAAMDILRTFFEEFIEEAATRVAPRVGKSVPQSGTKGVSHFGSFREFLRSADIVGHDEDLVLQRLYAYLSNEGSHKLGSAPEQFHVARVTVIEWCMMVAGRVQNYVG